MRLLLDDASQNLAPSTYRFYREHTAAVLALLPEDRPLALFTREMVETFAQERSKDVSPATVAKQLSVLARVFNLAAQAGWIDTNPCTAVRKPRHRARTSDYFEAAEMTATLRRLRKAKLAESAAVIEFLALSGLRRAECDRIRAEHFNPHGPTLWVWGKTASVDHPLSKRAAEMLEWLTTTAPDGQPLSESRLRRAFRAAREVIEDARLHPHALRHTYGTALAKVHPLQVTQRLMRHATPQQTMRYYHAGSELRQAASSLGYGRGRGRTRRAGG